MRMRRESFQGCRDMSTRVDPCQHEDIDSEAITIIPATRVCNLSGPLYWYPTGLRVITVTKQLYLYMYMCSVERFVYRCDMTMQAPAFLFSERNVCTPQIQGR